MSKHHDAAAVRRAMDGAEKQVFAALDVPDSFFSGKHQACPLCGGKDRARWAADRGAIYCNACGGPAGSGGLISAIDYLTRQGDSYCQAVDRVGDLLGLDRGGYKAQKAAKVVSLDEARRLRDIGTRLQIFERADPDTINADDMAGYQMLREDYQDLTGGIWPKRLKGGAQKWIPTEAGAKRWAKLRQTNQPTGAQSE